jgi:hypothetical protein
VIDRFPVLHVERPTAALVDQQPIRGGSLTSTLGRS